MSSRNSLSSDLRQIFLIYVRFIYSDGDIRLYKLERA